MVVLSSGGAHGIVSDVQRNRIERLAMELLANADNEVYALPALELLVTCIYVGKFFGDES